MKNISTFVTPQMSSKGLTEYKTQIITDREDTW